MRDPKRIRPLLEELARLWERNPDMRLGQIVVSAVLRYHQYGKTTDPYPYDDEELMSMVRRLMALVAPVVGCTCGHAKATHVGLDNAYACGVPGGCACAQYRAAEPAAAQKCCYRCEWAASDCRCPEGPLTTKASEQAVVRAALIQAIGDMQPDATSGQIADVVLDRFEVRPRP